MKSRTYAVLAAAAMVIAGLLLLSAAGCAAGRAANGSTVVGFPVGSQLSDGSATDLAGTAGGLIGGVFGGPGGALIGGSIATAIAGLIFGKKVADARADTANAAGQDAGWADRDKHQQQIDAAYDAGQLARATAPNPYAYVPAPAPNVGGVVAGVAGERG